MTEYAKQFGKADEFHHAAYKALGADGVNLGEFDSRTELATGVGRDVRAIRRKVGGGGSGRRPGGRKGSTPPARRRRGAGRLRLPANLTRPSPLRPSLMRPSIYET